MRYRGMELHPFRAEGKRRGQDELRLQNPLPRGPACSQMDASSKSKESSSFYCKEPREERWGWQNTPVTTRRSPSQPLMLREHKGPLGLEGQ